MQILRNRLASGVVAAATVCASLGAFGVGAANAATTDPNPGQLELAHAQLARQAAADGMVLLKNDGGSLPLAESGPVAVFGVGSYKTVKGGTGSGDVNNRYTISVRQGLENAGYTVTTSPGYYDAMKAAYDAKYANASGGFGSPTVDYSSVEQVLTADTVAPTAATDTAVFVLARSSGEGADRKSGAGDYLLTDVERNDIALIGQTYKNVVVLLNVGGVVDTSFVPAINADTKDPAGGEALDSVLLMSQGGQETGNAVADVLAGKVTPAGKLTDTWASKYSYYPASGTFANNDANSATEQYSEGIYVGYRYFDSKYATIDPADPAGVVSYPFGFGMSYTDFQVEPVSVTADSGQVTVRARVTNTGDTYSGRDTVQVYYSAPQGGLDEPYQELAAYGKTDVLAPGESQTLTISYTTTQMSSYDTTRAAEVMAAGDYVVRVGDSSRSTQVAGLVRLGDELVTEQLANEVNDQAPDSELTSTPEEFYSYEGEAAEIAAAPVITLDTTGFVTPDNSSEFQQDVAVDPASPYAAIDGSTISSVEAHVDPTVTDWEGTGAPYQAKTGETVTPTTPVAGATLFDVAKGTVSMDQFVTGLSLVQLATIAEGSSGRGSIASAVGAAGYTTSKYEGQGIPGMTLADGPAGLRITKEIQGSTPSYQFATAWPIGTALAQTWDRDLIQQVSAAIGAEMAEYGVTLWLAPGMNIHRDPLNGRNFEYYSEDPLVSGLTAVSTTLGVQSVPGIGVTIKHYAANSQETARTTSNSVIGERALREIYLRGFEIAVKGAQPMAVMTSYNKINGTYTSGSYDLDTDILRGEWGFGGLVMSDWGAGPRTGATAVMYAGNDLIEPGGNPGEIVNASKKTAPSIDSTGLPVYTKTVTPTRTSWSWQFNGLTPSVTGADTVSKTIDANTDFGAARASGTITRDAINNEVFAATAQPASVQAAYDEVQSYLTGANSSALNATQRPAITVTDVVRQNPADAASPVVSYTVTVRGNYSTTGYNLRLGDLQRSVSTILDVAIHTAGFEELATNKGVSGIDVGPYSEGYTDLQSLVSVTRGSVSDGTTERIDGVDRYEVSVNTSKAGFPGGADTVYVTSGEVFPDALSAAPAATLGGAPILLTQGAALPASVKDEIKRLAPKSIVIVGGESSVSAAVATDLASIGTVSRVSGSDRYATSREIAATSFASGSKVAVLATGTSFPDALSAGAAVDGKAPVILVDGSAPTIDDDTVALLEKLGVDTVLIAGGEASVSPGIATQAATFGSVNRLAGEDRYASSRAINAYFFKSADDVVIATGEKFPDALSGSAFAPRIDAPLFTVPGTCVPAETLAQIEALGANKVTLLGGELTLSPEVASLTPCAAG